MDQSEIAAAVQEFEKARAQREYFPRAWFDRLTLDDGYRILLALIGRRRGEGTRRTKQTVASKNVQPEREESVRFEVAVERELGIELRVSHDVGGGDVIGQVLHWRQTHEQERPRRQREQPARDQQGQPCVRQRSGRKRSAGLRFVHRGRSGISGCVPVRLNSRCCS